ncbi:MAG: hypothetical protein OEZ03_13735 [Alphaproteobacteria bacterium]|nr:hypothetical protein [Alphaproteobacteria bacterium]
MTLSPRTVFLLAPILGEVMIQAVTWGRALGTEKFEEGLAGVQMMLSTLPLHSGGEHPWILLTFPIFCIFSWELLEFIRDREPLTRLSGGRVSLPLVATGGVRRLSGFLAGFLGMLVVNFALGMATIVLVGAIGIAMAPGGAGEQILFTAIGIAYPLPLGFFVVWAYRSILRGQAVQGAMEDA